MSRIPVGGTVCLALAVIVGMAAHGQQPAARQHAPVPRQVVTARSAFIANAGGETYGAESYFDLTKYAGGPNRLYDEFYAAVRDWGHYDLVSSLDEADVSLVVRFANPIVNQENAGVDDDSPHAPIHDPQLDLTIADPRTGLTLWSITEHIDPTGGKGEADRHFDEAVTRLVDDLRRLILYPEESVASASNAPPPGAIIAAQRRRREMHAGIGMLLGVGVGSLIASHNSQSACPDFQFDRCVSQSRAHAELAFLSILGGGVAGALLGWAWPVN